MHQAHRRFNLVHVLTAFAAGRNVSISRSAGLTSIGAESAISGTTSTLANEVWRRLLASNGEILTTGERPVQSADSRRHILRTSNVTDLIPTSSPCLDIDGLDL